MEPFILSNGAKKLLDPFPPNQETFYKVLKSINQTEKEAIINSLITEGTAFFFTSNQMLYGIIRVWLARRLNISSKDITLIGSARLGYSLCSKPKYGTKFNEKSDIDLTIVSPKLFEKCSEAFSLWLDHYRSGKISPCYNEEKYWNDNSLRVPINIRNGFIDHYKIPFRDEYKIAGEIENALWFLTQKIKATKTLPAFSRVTSRIFKDWNSALKQMLLNLNYLVLK